MARFTGKPYDEDLQAHVFPFRNYSSELGRWTSADPAGFPDGPNRHFYAPVPTRGLDPLGLAQQTQIISGTGLWYEYDFYVEDKIYNYSFTYTSSQGGTVSSSVSAELSLTNTGIASSAGISISQLHSESVTVSTSWEHNGQDSDLDQVISGIPADQFVPSIPGGWSFDKWITEPTDRVTDTRDYGWTNATSPSGREYRTKGVFTDWEYSYSYQIYEN